MMTCLSVGEWSARKTRSHVPVIDSLCWKQIESVSHNPEVVGSNPAPATKSVTVVDTISTTVIFCLLPFWGCFWHETVDIPNISGHMQIVCPDLMRPWSEKTGLGKMTIVIRI